MTLIRNFHVAWVTLLALGLIDSSFAIEGLHLSLGTIDSDYIHAEQVRVDLDWQDPQRLDLSVAAQHITSPYTAPIRSLGIACRDVAYLKQRLYCAQGTLRLVYTDGTSIATAIEFSYDDQPGGQWHAGIADLGMDLLKIKALIEALLPGQELKTGRLQTRLQVRGRGQTLTGVQVAGQISDVSMDGSNVLEQVTADLHLDAKRLAAQWSLDTGITLRQGVMYIVPGVTILGDQPGFYIEIQDAPLSLLLQGAWSPGEQRLAVNNLTYTHPGLLSLQGSGTFDRSGLAAGTEFSLKAAIDDLDRAFPVYLQPLILQTGFSGIQLQGGVAIDLGYRDERLRHLNVVFNQVTLKDANDRFNLAGLHGNLAMGESQAPIKSTLAWNGMQFHRLPVGAGQVVFESSDNKVKVLNWKNVAVLDGELQINRFEMNGVGTPDFELTLDAGLSPISMKAFTQSMGWPLMSGTISGAFSGLRYAADTLDMNGDITIQVFDGKVILQDLRIADLFSQYSILTTDINVQALDLEQLTDTFEFGRIEGSLNGLLRDLRLEDWRPASFDARFETLDDDPRPHRISRKALNNLNELGGGLGGTMSKGFLRIFPSYSYGKLGLRCRLRNNIGELGGIKETDQGFYLLTRGGMLPPWVEVKAVGRSMPWNELIDGFKQISAGGIKIE